MQHICSLGLILLSTLILRAETTVGIYGGVQKPGKYSLAEGEGLIELVHQAGGFLPGSGGDQVKIVTPNTDGRKAIRIVDTLQLVDTGQELILPINATVFVSSCVGLGIGGLWDEKLAQYNDAVARFAEAKERPNDAPSPPNNTNSNKSDH
ncbi:hypothetical protein [Cerasicoccus maritimus]|uniref:hypothetical protein n=1 Tax=Cerasicoccus maritimus TaxID=490089 RepID=UPI002852937D|nr:hypothetical protein [Cerasicoccus maritimus]